MKVFNTKCLIIIVLLSVVSSCSIIEKAWSPCGSPDIKSYKYYNPNFVFDSLSKLNTDEIYIQTTYTSDGKINLYHLFKFFKNGMVKHTIQDGQKLPRYFLKANNIGRAGYYIFENDSIKFTTNICRTHEFEQMYDGVVKNDTVFLNRYFVGNGYKQSGKVDEFILTAKSISEIKDILAACRK